MFKRKPIDLSSKSRAVIPEGEQTRAARARVADLKTKILAAESRQLELAAQSQSAEQLRVEATERRNTAEALVRRAALGEKVRGAPDAAELSDLIVAQARAEANAHDALARTAPEVATLTADLAKLRNALGLAEVAIEKARFEELVGLYAEAVRPLLPIARALRAAAANVHRHCDGQPLLVDPDDENDNGGQVFGVAVNLPLGV
jgi:hypothetical protein